MHMVLLTECNPIDAIFLDHTARYKLVISSDFALQRSAFKYTLLKYVQLRVFEKLHHRHIVHRAGFHRIYNIMEI